MADDDDLYDDLYAPTNTADHHAASASSHTNDEFGLDGDAGSSANKGALSGMQETKPAAGPSAGDGGSGAASFIPASSAPAQKSSFIPAPQGRNTAGASFIPQPPSSASSPQAHLPPPPQQASGLPPSLQQRPSHLPQPLGLAAGHSGSVTTQQQSSSGGGGGGGGGNDDGQKMFVGGLSWDTTEDGLRQYFSAYGKVLECNIMKDPNTGTSRGFGFLKFEDPKAVNGVMVREHWLDGKIIDPKRAIPRDSSSKSSKIFVGGIPLVTTSESFRRTFLQFGPILDHNLMMDKETSKPRGFGFVTFESEDSGRRALEMDGNVLLDGKMVDIKRATSKNAPGSNTQDSSATVVSSSNRRPHQQTNIPEQAATPDFAAVQAALQMGGGAFNPMMVAGGGMDMNAMSSLFTQNGWGTGHWNPAMMQQMLMGAATAQQANGGSMGSQWNPMMMGGMGMGMNPMMGGMGGYGGMGMDNSAWMGGTGQGYGAGAGYGQQSPRAAASYGGMNRGAAGMAQGYQRNNASRATPTGPSSLPTQPRSSGLPSRPSSAATAAAGSPPSGPAGDLGGRGRDASGSADPYRRERSPSRRAGGSGAGGYEERALR